MSASLFISLLLLFVPDALLRPKPPPTPSLDQLLAARKSGLDRLRRKLPDSLPPEDNAHVDVLFSKHGVIAKCVREQVTDKDISRLRPHQWLNDEIINFYGQMIMSRFEESKENPGGNGYAKGRKRLLNVHYFSTFFWSKLQNDGYEKGRLAKWTKKVVSFNNLAWFHADFLILD